MRHNPLSRFILIHQTMIHPLCIVKHAEGMNSLDHRIHKPIRKRRGCEQGVVRRETYGMGLQSAIGELDPPI